jgi:O-antigen/teichoic acid export membrane protein
VNVRSIASTYCPTFLRAAFGRLEASPLGMRLARGVFWSIAGTATLRVLTLAASILVARMLGKDVFGEYGIIRTTVGMLGIFAGLGLGLTATKHVAEFRKSDPQRAGRIIALSWLAATAAGSMMSLVLFILAPWLAEHTLNAPHLTGVLRAGSLMLLVNSLVGAQTGVLSGFEAFKSIARVNVFTGLASFPVLVCGTYFGGLTGAVCALTVNLALNWLFNHLALREESRRHGVPIVFKDCGRELPVLWKFSLPAFLAGTVAQPAYWVCLALLANQPGGYAEVGIFTAANQWYATLLFLPAMLRRVVLPVVSNQMGQGNAEQAMRTLVVSLKTNLMLTVPLVVGACFASPVIMRLYGEQFAPGWSTLVFLLLAVIVKSAISPVGTLVISSGKVWLGFAANCLWAVTIITGTLALVDHGSIGLAVARLISFILSALCNYFIALWIVRSLRQRGAARHSELDNP